MIKKNQRALNLVNGSTDFLIVFLSLLLSYWLRFYVMPGQIVGSFYHYLILSGLNATMCIVLYILFRLYEPKRRTGFVRDSWIILRANLINVLMLGLSFFFVRMMEFSRLLLLIYLIINTVLVSAKHSLLRTVLNKIRVSGRNQKHILLIGTGTLAQSYLHALAKNPQLGYQVAKAVSCKPDCGSTLPGVKVVGQLSTLDNLLKEHNFDEAIIALDEDEVAFTKAAIQSCNASGVRFSIIPYFTEYCFIAAAPEVQLIDDLQIYDACASPLDSFLNRALKRGLDFVAAVVIATITAPIMLIAALGVKLMSPGPILFKQKRVGRKNKTFYIYKFRSMRINSDEATGWSHKGDHRVTRWGKFIRKTSIDELPQLFNILKGDMSLVGPRPEVPFHVDHFKDEIPYYMARHQIRPGLTGWAQVNGYRGDTSIEKRVQYDLFYIYNWSLALDIRIIFKTVFGGIISSAE